MAWSVVNGPRQFDSLGGRDMDVGWAYDLERDGQRKTVSVIVAGGRAGSDELPDESRRARSTKGRSAIDSLVDRDELPRYVIVTSFGLREELE